MNHNWKISHEEFWNETTGDDTNELEALRDLADGFEGYEALDFHWYVQQVGDRLFNIHQSRDILDGGFLFTLTCNADGEIDGGEIALGIPGESVYLMRSLEYKRMSDDRSATGEAGLIAIKSALMDEYAALRTYANRHGLWS